MRRTKERRRYLRLKTTLPVEFTILDNQHRRITPYFQGFTRDIGWGGILLAVNDLWWGFSDRLLAGKKLFLQVEFPVGNKQVVFLGKIVWRKQTTTSQFKQIKLGVEFSKDSAASKHRWYLYFWALGKKAFKYLVATFIVLASVIIAYNWALQQKMESQRRQLIRNYKQAIVESEQLREQLQQEQEYSQDLISKQQRLNSEITLLQRKLSDQLAQKKANKTEVTRLKQQITRLKNQRVLVQDNIEKVQQSTAYLRDNFNMQKNKMEILDVSIIQGLYRWIKNRQDMRSGLVLSYEGDRRLKEVAFTYDQALATFAFVVFGDLTRAKKVLDFYYRKLKQGQSIYNAYYTSGQVQEYTIHSGVNAWLGLAALEVYQRTHQDKYLFIAEQVASFLDDIMQDDGGIKGGPDVSWYSTEHNLDAYAFFQRLYKIKGEKKYSVLRDKVKRWLDLYAYTSNPVPINRGKGDATIATDTYTWSIAALGPRTLKALRMDPDEIIAFAVKNSRVTADFSYEGKTIQVQGFDFAKAQHLARGGILSCEWSAQMIIAFEIMADYYRGKGAKEKANYYKQQAAFYFSQLQKMIISSPSPVGKADPTLPYASAANVTTGHGWRTPKGNSTGSLAATAYFLFAYKGFNPLDGRFLDTKFVEKGDFAGNQYNSSQHHEQVSFENNR